MSHDRLSPHGPGKAWRAVFAAALTESRDVTVAAAEPVEAELVLEAA